MAGWIKIEKDLESDPRVLRMAKALDRLHWIFPAESELDPCNAIALPGVTLVCGALARLWIFADSHIRNDNTLDMGVREIDEWLGLPNFCSVMPKDWLKEIDDHTVELPGFQEHNGLEARKRALTQKRVEHHRASAKRNDVTDSNASALPDQTRLDQTRLDKKEDRTARRNAPTSGWFADFQAAYPKRGGDQGWQKATRAAAARLREGHHETEMIAGAQRYAAFCEVTGKLGTEYVKQACTFLGPDKHFLNPWNPPATKADVRLGSNLAAAQEFMRRTDETTGS